MGIRHSRLGQFLLHWTNWHKQGSKPNIFIFSTPRSGSTWTKELFGSQSGVRFCNEPFNLRNTYISDYFKTQDWAKFHSSEFSPEIYKYLDLISEARSEVAFFNPFPFRQHYRWPTRRTVFKVLHALEDRVGEVEDRYGAKVVLLLRHPLAVSLSRKNCPRLSTLISSDYAQNFTDEQITFAKTIVESGTDMEKLVLSWCLQNAVMLRSRREHWLTITYEQLTLEPDLLLDVVCKELELDNIDKIKSGLGKASASSSQSSVQTQEVLSSSRNTDRSQYLVEKWRSEISADEEKHLMSFLTIFDIDAYTVGDTLPATQYWIKN